MLNSTADVDNPGRPETRRQHAPEIRYAVGQRIHVRPARHRRLRRHKLLLQILDCFRNHNQPLSSRYLGADRLPADLCRNIESIDGAYHAIALTYDAIVYARWRIGK